MYLVDTSVWVDYIRGRDRQHVGFLRERHDRLSVTVNRNMDTL